MAESSPYRPPLADYAFILQEVFGTDVVAAATDGALTGADAEEILAAAGDFAAQVLAPLDAIGDREGARLDNGRVRLPEGFAEAYRAFVDAGWITADAPESAGGDGLPGAVRAGLNEMWNAANAAFALCWLLTAGQIHALDAAASAHLRDTYLTKLVSGEWTGTMNLTEPDAGTDLGAIRTTATPRPDGTWALRGQKIFITWGDHDIAENIVHLVLARTPDAPEGAKGLSLFVVPKYLVGADGSVGERNAVTTRAVEHKLGIHGSPTCALSFEDATGYLVGDLHGGLAGMFVMMNSARVGMGFQATGIADRAYQAAAAYAAERRQGRVLDRPAGTPIAEHPDVRRLLLSMSSQIFAMRALGVYVGDLLDREEGVDAALGEFFVPILKGWTTEDAIGVTSDAVQVPGGMGFIEETGVAQHYRDIRITPIYEGTTAIQSNDLVGRKVIRDGGAVAEELFRRMDATVASLRTSSAPEAARAAEQLERAVDAGRRATASLLGFASSPRDAHAVSVPYLMLLGVLSGGWMHALAVDAVLAHAEPAPADAARLISDQLIAVSTTAASKAGLGLVIALVLSIYGAMRAASAIIQALNVIYEEDESRNFIQTTLASALLTLGAVFAALVGLLSAGAMAYLQNAADILGRAGVVTIQVLTWAVAIVIASSTFAFIYRYAPDRARAQWQWLSVGSVAATLLWLVATLGFGLYAANFANYNATYGALGAVVVLLMWLFVSCYAVLIGAEINAEAERQTGVDSTTGRPRPQGHRGATMADQLPSKRQHKPRRDKY